jgi:hypothetical protein
MENRFYVEAKSFLFSVGLGIAELRVLEKRKAFFGVILLGSHCIVWLLSMLEEALRNPRLVDFLKSYREGSKVTIVRKGENSSGRFLEVAVYDVGGRKGLVCFSKVVMGEDGVVSLASCLKSWLFLKMPGRRWGRQLGLFHSRKWCVQQLPSLSRTSRSSVVPRTLC